MGTGTVDMIRRCIEAGLREPEFEVDAAFVTKVWRDQRTTRKTTQKTARKQPRNRQKTAEKQPEGADSSREFADRLLAVFRRNPSASRREIAETLGIPESTARYRLDRLRKAGKIERVGPNKGGHWKMLDGAASDTGPAPEPDPGGRR